MTVVAEGILSSDEGVSVSEEFEVDSEFVLGLVVESKNSSTVELLEMSVSSVVLGAADSSCSLRK